jgi:hypothetical protein
MLNKPFAHCSHLPTEATHTLSTAYDSISKARGLISDTGKAANRD